MSATLRTLRPLLSIAILTLALPAAAQASRTWVSGTGDDVNPCSRTAPCRTFAGAISKTAAAGEINVLDPGGPGAISITKSITIDGRNTKTGVLVTGGLNGITVNAAATDTVVIRGLDINGLGTGNNGINILQAKMVVIEDTSIYGFAGHGISIDAASTASVVLRNVVLRNNATANLTARAGDVLVVKSALDASPLGVEAIGAARVTIDDTTLFNHSVAAVDASGTSEVNVERSVLSANGTAINATSHVRVSNSLLGHNGTGLVGNVSSFGNNRLNAGNTTSGTVQSTLSQQ